MKDVQELLACSTLGNRLLDGSLSVLSDELLSSESLGVRVESEEDGLVSERVLLLGEGSWWSATFRVFESKRSFGETGRKGKSIGGEMRRVKGYGEERRREDRMMWM